MKKSFVKRYIEYLKDNPEHYWFKKRLFGWGWTPATKEGWLTTLVFVIAILFLAFRLEETVTGIEVVKQLLVPLVVLVFVFVYIAYKKGEKPVWSWGFPEEKKGELDSERE